MDALVDLATVPSLTAFLPQLGTEDPTRCAPARRSPEH
jgi:hypothetical protein